MVKYMKKIISILFLLSLISSSIFASSINFSSGYTNVSMQEGNQFVSLSNNAKVEIDNISIKANEITLSGENYNLVKCKSNIEFVDSDNKLTLRCSSLKYNQEKELIIINGWCEINDLQNSIYATASYLEYNLDKNILDLMIEVNLLHESDNKIMKCNSDTLRFDINNKILSLLGSSKIEWDSNTYKAQAMSINLNNNDISMDGNIEANINTK